MAKTFINVPLVANITPAKRAKNIPTGLACRLMNLSLVEEFSESSSILNFFFFLTEFVGQDVIFLFFKARGGGVAHLQMQLHAELYSCLATIYRQEYSYLGQVFTWIA